MRVQIPEDLCVGRVTHEDDDFITLEIAKHDDVKWTVAPLPGQEEPVAFHSLLFLHNTDQGMEVWKPWER